MKKILSFLAAPMLALAVAIGGPALAQGQTPTPPAYSVLGGQVSLAVSNSSTRVALPASITAYGAVTVYNSGAVDAYVALGGSSISAIASSTCTNSAGAPPGPSCLVAAGTVVTFWASSGTYVAAITSASTTTLAIYQASGPIQLSPGGAASSGGGSATAANQATQITAEQAIQANTNHLPAALGQGTQAQSLPVVLPSDPDSRPASGNITIVDTGSTTTAGFNSVNLITGTPTVGSVKNYAINGQSSASCTVTGTWTGTLTFELSADGASYVASTMRQRGSSFRSATLTGNGVFDGDVSGKTNFRTRATAAMTGTAVVQCSFSTTSGPVQVQNPVSVFDNSSNQAVTVKAASTAPAASDPAMVVALSPNGNNVGGYEFNASVLPTTTNASHAAGVALADLQTISIGSTNGLSGILTQVQYASKGGSTSGVVVYIWSKNPAATTCTNGSALVPSQVDNEFLAVPPFLLTPALVLSATDTTTYAAASNLVGNFVNGSSNTNLYVCLVANATQTPATTTDIRLNIQGIKDQP